MCEARCYRWQPFSLCWSLVGKWILRKKPGICEKCKKHTVAKLRQSDEWLFNDCYKGIAGQTGRNLENNCSGNDISILMEANTPKSIEADLSNTSSSTVIEAHTPKCTEEDISQTHQYQKILPSLNRTQKADSGETISSSSSTSSSSSKSASTDPSSSSSSLNETHLLLYKSLVQHFNSKQVKKVKNNLSLRELWKNCKILLSWFLIYKELGKRNKREKLVRLSV